MQKKSPLPLTGVGGEDVDGRMLPEVARSRGDEVVRSLGHEVAQIPKRLLFLELCAQRKDDKHCYLVLYGSAKQLTDSDPRLPHRS